MGSSTRTRRQPISSQVRYPSSLGPHIPPNWHLTTFFGTTAWESLEAHQRVTADVESFTKFVAGVGTLFDPSQGPPQMFHVKVAHEPYTAFSAPVLDFATFTLLEPEKESRATLEGYMEEIVRTAPRTPEAVGTTWGPVVEKPDTVALFIGWSGVEVSFCALVFTRRHGAHGMCVHRLIMR